MRLRTASGSEMFLTCGFSMWTVAPPTCHIDWRRIDGYGCGRRDGNGPFSTCRAIPLPADLTVERVVGEEELAQSIDLHPHYLENDQRDEPRERLYVSLGLLGINRCVTTLPEYMENLPVPFPSFFGRRPRASTTLRSPSVRGSGVGTAITRAVLEEARRLGSRIGVVGPTREPLNV